MFVLRPESAADGPAVESLLDLCFGPNRHAKASYRFRGGVPPVTSLSFVAEEEGTDLVGAIRYWPIRLGAASALLLGPLAIRPDRQGRGIGRVLVFRTLADALALGHRLVFLVGDPAYYRRFGFEVAPRTIVMPGEQPWRLQYALLGDGRLLEAGGTLRPERPLERPEGADVALDQGIRYNQPVGA
ncbi:MAG: N-acetyltransferase [Geminicoccaceae bacterium]|nr:N-acetyltransferase [Geminicoccaceae bacterium]